MAITVATSRIDLDPRNFWRGKPICSGEGAADRKYGWEGTVREASHAYAHRVQTFTSKYDVSDPLLAQVAGGVGGNSDIVVERFDIELGDDVFRIVARADIELGYIRIVTDEGAGGYSAKVGARGTSAEVSYSLVDTSGAVRGVTLELKADATETAKIYAYCIREDVLVAGDFASI